MRERIGPGLPSPSSVVEEVDGRGREGPPTVTHPLCGFSAKCIPFRTSWVVGLVMISVSRMETLMLGQVSGSTEGDGASGLISSCSWMAVCGATWPQQPG